MMKKKLVILFFLTLSVTTATFAAEINQLDLSTAVNIAIEQNYDLQLARLKLAKAKLEYQRQNASNLLTPSKYSKLSAEFSLAAAENTYQNSLDHVISSTISQYNTIWLANLDLEIKNKQLELAKKELAQAKAQYEIGDIGSIALLEQENKYQDAQFTLEKNHDDYQHNLRTFRITLRLEQNELLPEKLAYPTIWEIDEQEAITTALNNSRDLKLREDEIELARIDLERAEVSSSELDWEIKEITLKLTELEKEKTSEEVTTTTQEKYYQFKQTIKDMELKKEQLTEAEEKYLLFDQQHKLGLVTPIELLQYEINLLQAKYRYQAVVANYYLHEQVLKQSINRETGVFLDGTTAQK